jgi:hypothetical protein
VYIFFAHSARVHVRLTALQVKYPGIFMVLAERTSPTSAQISYFYHHGHFILEKVAQPTPTPYL